MTAATKRALKILEAKPGGLKPSDFAEAMWPDSSGWKRIHKCGPGASSPGVCMALAAGGFLGRLRKQGLTEIVHLECFSLHRLTKRGREALYE